MGKGGDSTDLENPTILSDPRFQPFRNAQFDVAQFTSQVLAGSHTTAQAQSEQLRDGARALETELQSQVTARHRELLQNSRRLLETEHTLQDIVLSVGSLHSAVKRIRGEILGPYELIKVKSRQLKNLHDSVEILRHLIHRLKLAHKLRAQLAAPEGQADLAKAAKLISDIRAVDAEIDLSDIDVVRADGEFLKNARSTTRDKAHAALMEGMESLSQAKVGSALQVFFNLDEMPQEVASIIAGYIHNLDKRVKAALDARLLNATPAVALARGATGPNANTSWQEKLWAGLKDVFEALATASIGVWHLQRVVAKKKDPLTHVCFLDVLVAPHEPLLTTRFWSEAMRCLSDAFGNVSKPTKGGVVRDALISGYPRLAVLSEATYERVVSETSMKGSPAVVGTDSLASLLASASALQSAHLAACGSRMSDAVAAAFPGGSRSLPSPSDVQKCIGTMHEELKASGSSAVLASLLAGCCCRALALVCERAEMMAAPAAEMRAMSATPNAAQVRNIAICSQLQEIHRSMTGLLPRLPSTAPPLLQPSLRSLQDSALAIVSPLFRALGEALEERVNDMHNRRFASGGGSRRVSAAGDIDDVEARVVETSPHITDACNIITTFRSEFLSKFVPAPSPNIPSCVTTLVERLAARLLAYFVRHAALVRPLGASGKLQLAKDMGELSQCVGSALYPLEQLGAAARVTKAFRALLFMETGAIIGSPLVRELPRTVLLSHMFARLPLTVKTPHQLSGLTPVQYSLWLDQHSAAEAMEHFQNALAANPASSSLSPEQAEALEVMRQICSSGLS